METVIIKQRTLTVGSYKNLPRKKKKKMKKAMQIEWHEEPIDVSYLQTNTLTS